MNAGLAVQATVGLDSARVGPWAGLGILTAWAAAGLTAGAIRFARSDAA